MPNEVRTFPDPNSVASALANEFVQWAGQQQQQEKLTVAISGGSTPKLLFEKLVSDHANAIDWSRLHFFWCDERCVPMNDPESNCGVATALLFEKVDIPNENVHAVDGDADPDEERSRYENEIYEHVEIDDDAIPEFDYLMLGIGEDGHTASIFPHQSQFLTSDQVCEVAIHPETAQKRITLTGPVLANAKQLVFMLTGVNKAEVLAHVINQSDESRDYPAAQIQAESATFFVDEAAASKLG